MKTFLKYSFSLAALVTLGMSGCKKADTYPFSYPEPEVHFVTSSSSSYSILADTTSPFNVQIGTTDVTNQDRIVTYNVVSTTGAVAGTNYTIANGNTTGTVTIPAGQSIANLPIKGIFAPYNATGRKDVLKIYLSLPSIKPSTFSDTLFLTLRGPCFEGDVNLNAFLGTYTKSIETFGSGAPYGPYKTTVSKVVSTGPTTGIITVTNLFDAGWGPIDFILDWTNPNMRTATVVSQNAIPGSNAGDLSSTYAGQTIAVRPLAGSPGTFSACNGTLDLQMQLGVTNVGFFGSLYRVTLAR